VKSPFKLDVGMGFIPCSEGHPQAFRRPGRRRTGKWNLWTLAGVSRGAFCFGEMRHLPSDLGMPGRHLVANPSESAQKMRGTSILVERLYIG
jgi:hypothetical protein